MNQTLLRALSAALVLGEACSGGPTEPAPIPGLFRRAVALTTQTGIPGMTAVLADTSGTTMAVYASGATVQRVIERTKGGSLVRIDLGADGRPMTALFGSLVVRYSNWTGTTVDVAVTTGGTGTPVYVARSLELPAELSALAAMLQGQPNPASAASGQLTTILNSAGLGLAMGACVAGMLATPATFGAAAAVVAITCGTTMAKTVNFFVGVEDDPLVLAGDGFGTLSDVLGCASREPLACAGSVMTLLTGAADQLEALSSSMGTSQTRLADALRNNYTIQPSPVRLSVGRNAAVALLSSQSQVAAASWISQNASVASVSQSGSVTGVSKGTTAIVAFIGSLGVVGKVVVTEPDASDPGDVTGVWHLQMYSNVPVGQQYVSGNLCASGQVTGKTLLTDGVLKITATGSASASYSLKIRFTYVQSSNGTSGQVYADSASGTLIVIPPVAGLGPPDGNYWHLAAGPSSQGTVLSCRGTTGKGQYILAPYYRTARGLETQGFASGDVWGR